MSDTAELLAELATIDEVEAWIPTSSDHLHERTPKWCELVLTAKRGDDGSLNPAWPLNVTIPMRTHDGELIMQVLWDVLHPERQIVAVDQLYVMLDAVVDKIQKAVRKKREPKPVHVGHALGLAESIALLVNPVNPDVDLVREVAMERYAARRS